MNKLTMYYGIILAICLGLAEGGACRIVLGQVPGGANNAAVNDADVIAAAKFAVRTEQKALNAAGQSESLVLLKIVSAQKQVVAGMNYFLTLSVKLGDKETTANATVYTRAWENKVELTNWKFADDTAAGANGGVVAPSPNAGSTSAVAARKPVAFTVHDDGYFVSNKYEPDAATSFAVITDQTVFDKAFQETPLHGPHQKPHLLPSDAFDTKIVVAAVHRGKGAWTYKGHSVQLEGNTLVVRYGVFPQTLTFETACPMIVSVPKGDYAAVRFVENNQEVKTLNLGTGTAATDTAPAGTAPAAAGPNATGGFDPNKDIVSSKNPCGPWSYGYTTADGTFQTYDFFGTFQNGETKVVISWDARDPKHRGTTLTMSASKPQSGPLYPPGQLCLGSNIANKIGDMATLRWTAPQDGTVVISGTLSGVATSTHGMGGGVARAGIFSTVMDARFICGKDELFSAALNQGRTGNSADFNFRRAVKSGEFIDLNCANKQKDNSFIAVKMKIGYAAP